MLVDTEGLLLAVLVLAADVSDRDGALLLLQLYAARYPELRLLWGDRHYGGELSAELEAVYGIRVEVVSKPEGQEGFIPPPTAKPGFISRRSIGCSSCSPPTLLCRCPTNGPRRPSLYRTRSQRPVSGQAQR